MKALLRIGLVLALPLLAAAAAPLPYDTTADAHRDVQQALAAARSQDKDVLVIFGANWCEDCRELDRALHGSSAALIDSRFIVVKIDVGNFDRNLDLANRYGNPIHKGIPAAVVLTPGERVMYATQAGELANARHMGERGIYDFLSKELPARTSP